MFQHDKNVIQESAAKQLRFLRFCCGVDTSYSEKSDDTIAFLYQGITAEGCLVVLEEKVYNNKDFRGEKIAPSDVVVKLHEFIEYCKDKWGFCRVISVDNADQATLMELRKYKQQKGLAWDFINANKKLKVIDRINLAGSWIKNGYYLVVNHCTNHIHELEIYSWKEDKDEPEDRNDHTINAGQYGWIPHIKSIGQKVQDASYEVLRAGLR